MNMTNRELERRLQTEESQSVGWDRDDVEHSRWRSSRMNWATTP